MLQITSPPAARPQAPPHSFGNHVVATVAGNGPSIGVAPDASRIASTSLASSGVDLLSTFQSLLAPRSASDAPADGTVRLPNSWGSDSPSTVRLYLNDLMRMRVA